jgi:hypothetical protein
VGTSLFSLAKTFIGSLPVPLRLIHSRPVNLLAAIMFYALQPLGYLSANELEMDISVSTLPDYLVVAERYDLPTDAFEDSVSGSNSSSSSSNTGSSSANSNTRNSVVRVYPGLIIGLEKPLKEFSLLSVSVRGELGYSRFSASFPEGYGVFSEAVKSDFQMLRLSIGPKLSVCSDDKTYCLDGTFLYSTLKGQLTTNMGSWRLKDNISDQYFQSAAAVVYRWSPLFISAGVQSVNSLRGLFVSLGTSF